MEHPRKEQGENKSITHASALSDVICSVILFLNFSIYKSSVVLSYLNFKRSMLRSCRNLGLFQISRLFIRVALGFVFYREGQNFNQKFVEFYSNLCKKCTPIKL